MRITILPLAFFIAAYIFLSTCNTAFAQDATPSAHQVDIGYSKIHPASPFYFLKAVREKLEMEFAQTYRVKMLRHLEFATRRLREVKTLLSINQTELVPPTLERYAAHLKEITDKPKKNDPFLSLMQNNLNTHIKTLEEIYYKTTDPRAKLFLRSTMNRMIQRADVQIDDKLPICHLFAKESTGSADLNETEKAVLLNRSKLCFEPGKI